ncbi:S49 family peptidase [Bartonella sp. DGB2]|uniref:S49 family peptidase n=1 Tax=Bartonella sp. DGB2 TaxID=3388426 RepID=UPI00398FAC77
MKKAMRTMNEASFPYMSARLFNTPHMITSDKLEMIIQGLEPRLFSENLAAIKGQNLDTVPFNVVDNIAVLPVHGTLVTRGGYMAAQSGLVSYPMIGANFAQALARDDVKGILLDIDSSGGESNGIFDLVADMRAQAQACGKPVWSIANYAACSAAYMLACVGEKIYTTQTSTMGSIGVVWAHIDQSKADAQAGNKWTLIHSGKNKIDGNTHRPLSDDAFAKMQNVCDQLYEMFVTNVAHTRGLDAECIRQTQASSYFGIEAVAHGLADGVASLDETLLRFQQSINLGKDAAMARHLKAQSAFEDDDDEKNTSTQESEKDEETPHAEDAPAIGEEEDVGDDGDLFPDEVDVGEDFIIDDEENSHRKQSGKAESQIQQFVNDNALLLLLT